MNAVLNHIAVPFFQRVPTRGKPVVLAVFDGIAENAWHHKEAFLKLSNDLRQKDIEPPTLSEFQDWYARVKNGLVERPHPSEVFSDISTTAVNPYKPSERGPEERFFRSVKQPLTAACVIDTSSADPSRLEHARAIILAAHRLFEAKLAAGYSPLSIGLDDTIVQEALRDVLSAEATETVMDADTHMTPGNKLVDLLLGEADDDIDAKLVDCLTIDMQAEICALLVQRMSAPDTRS
ncbi:MULTISPECIES: hypothetical protein [Agrobacterium]|uniref:DUF3768 domain-containing protein n=1 Tax=Agrobacterium salinitolerans TaxID=1183413 RepID=A0ABY3BV86_9HYPH|nr:MULTISPECIES: hypothetical protein [Agrobacterium]TRA97007.1 hypothetical protein EXN23_01880 [Agrobacterium salinitolerans]